MDRRKFLAFLGVGTAAVTTGVALLPRKATFPNHAVNPTATHRKWYRISQAQDPWPYSLATRCNP